MIVADGLTKRFGETIAAEDVSFEVHPGQVVGFLGHNGAGKTTTLRMLFGHVRPDEGTATFFGEPLAKLDHPLRRIGVMLDDALHPGRTARDHLRVVAATGGIAPTRVDEMLDLVGLHDAAGRRCGGFSTGMRQRLGIAAALLAQPEVLVLDEPASGLDPEGIRWLRGLLRRLADNGCAVLVSSHHLQEIGQTADHVVIMDRGRVVAESSIEEVRREAGGGVAVRTPGAEVLAAELERSGIATSSVGAERLEVADVPPRVVSEVASAADIPIWELSSSEPDLEQAFFELIERRRRGADSEDGDGSDDDGGDTSEDDEAPGALDADEALEATEAELDRDLDARPTLGAPKVVAVVSPSSSGGRTTLAYLLADALAATARLRTLAVALSCDADRLTLPAAEEERSSLALADLLNDLPGFDRHARIDPYVSTTPSGAGTLAGVARIEALDALEAAHVDALLRFAKRTYDVVVVDVGDVPEEAMRATIAGADAVLVLGSPDVPPPPDAPVLRLIEQERDDPSLLVTNAVDPARARPLVNSPMRDVAVVPRDRDLIRRLDRGAFELASVEPLTRVALKRLAHTVLERLP